MKKITLLMLIIGAVCLVNAVTVFTVNGREYNGELAPSQINMIALNDDGVIIQIPVNRVRAIVEDGSDITKAVLSKAMTEFGSDTHFLYEEDYFITDKALDKNPWIRVYLGKMLKPASTASKNRADFVMLTDGKSMQTKYYYKTKIADKEELKPDDIVICLEASAGENLYRAPKTEEEARTLPWLMAKITDLSSLSKGFVTLSNGMNVELDNIRVITH